jgi:hypothetical protein
MQQPKIQHDLLQRLARVACAYEMPAAKMLNHVLAVALDELEGKEDDYTIVIPNRAPEPENPQ